MSNLTNPFGSSVQSSAPNLTPAPFGMNAAMQQETARAIAEAQSAMMIAKLAPRDTAQALNRIKNACAIPRLAEMAVYSYAKGGSAVQGPSIRLAEAIAQNWGNISFGIRELSQQNGTSTVQAFAWDLETNTKREVVFQVDHVRHTKKGSYRLTDPREIYELVANNGARRVRACIIGVIPGYVFDEALNACDATLKTTAEVNKDVISALINVFAEMGVSRKQLEAYVQRNIETIQPAQLVQLRKIYASIRDEMSAPSDWFPQVEEETKAKALGAKGVKSRLLEKKKDAAEIPPVTNGTQPEMDPVPVETEAPPEPNLWND